MIIRIILTILIIAVCNSACFSEQILIVTGEWEPYTTEKRDDNGYFSEIVTATFMKMGITPKYKFMPWKRAEKMVEKGKAFATMPYRITKKRLKKYAFSDKVTSSVGKFFYYKPRLKSKPKWEKFEDLKNFSICGILGYWYVDEFKKANLKCIFVASDLQAVKMLKYGHVDIIASEKIVAWELIKKLYPDKIDDFGTLDKDLNRSDLHLMISKSYPKFQSITDDFNKNLKKLLAERKEE